MENSHELIFPIHWPKPTLMVPFDSCYHWGALFYLIVVPQASLSSSGNQLQHDWPAFIFWPVTKKDVDPIQICVRCVVTPLSCSQRIPPTQRGFTLRWFGLMTLGQLSTYIFYSRSISKGLGAGPCSVGLSSSSSHWPHGLSAGPFCSQVTPLQHIS